MPPPPRPHHGCGLARCGRRTAPLEHAATGVREARHSAEMGEPDAKRRRAGQALPVPGAAQEAFSECPRALALLGAPREAAYGHNPEAWVRGSDPRRGEPGAEAAAKGPDGLVEEEELS